MGERSVNKAILIGRLGSDAETRHTESGTPVSGLAGDEPAVDRLRSAGSRRDRLDQPCDLEQGESRRISDKGTKLYAEGGYKPAPMRTTAGEAICHRGGGPKRRAARK